MIIASESFCSILRSKTIAVKQFRKYYILFFVIISFSYLSGQAYLPYDHGIYHYKERLNHLYKIDSSYHSSTRKIRTTDLAVHYKDCTTQDISPIDLFLFEEFRKELAPLDSDVKPRGIIGSLYSNPAHLLSVDSKDFKLYLNGFSTFMPVVKTRPVK